MTYDVTVEALVAAPGLDVSGLKVLAERVLAGEARKPETGLSVVITSDSEMQRLNKAFLDIDEPTDVLSFPDDDSFPGEAAAAPYLGDIAIGIETARRQASEHQHTVDAEVAHLLVHGILHLCGYDHVNGGDEERRMREREEHYLGALGGVHGHDH